MAGLEELSYLVIPDTHGRYEQVARIVDTYDAKIDKFVFLGDVLNGPDPRQLIKFIRELGHIAITVVGNHEWVYRNALSEKNESMAKLWRRTFMSHYEDGTLESYGIRWTRHWDHNAYMLREVMGETGDLEWLNSLPTHFETDTFIALHAGPELDKPWSKQASQLEEESDNRIVKEPTQILSQELAHEKDVPETVDERAFITGHAHLKEMPIKDRIGQRRVRLASDIWSKEPFFVWNSITKAVEACSYN